MSTNDAVLTKPFQTDRKDLWWVGPLLTAMGLGGFGLYSTFRAFSNVHYEFGPYLSPFYSPLIQIPGIGISPALLILWAPLGFRATCYYYRKAYYRAFFMDPVACGVNEIRGPSYKGEKSFPFIIQNIHRYFMYVAVIFIGILWYDVYKAMWFDNGAGGTQFGIGVGTIVMAINTTLLGSYTLGCHSLRHLVGGKVDCFSCTKAGPLRYKGWMGISFLNSRHQLFAWCSLFSVGFTDFYIYMCSLGVFKDVRLF